MVSEVNETLDDEEILGYSVSIYDADKHELEKVQNTASISRLTR